MRTIRRKKALVTGAASGIGRAIALALARQGADLYLLDVHEANLSAVAAEARRFGVTVFESLCDVACPDQVSAKSAKSSRSGTRSIFLSTTPASPITGRRNG